MKYHYTTGLSLPLILADEVIRPTELHLVRGERGVAWFTTRETFEPTAIPVFAAFVKEKKFLPLPKVAVVAHGLYRFGVRDDHPQLHPWLKICRLARTPNKFRVALERVAREEGGNPYTYWGSLTPISVYECTLEESSDGISWQGALSKAASAGE